MPHKSVNVDDAPIEIPSTFPSRPAPAAGALGFTLDRGSARRGVPCTPGRRTADSLLLV